MTSGGALAFLMPVLAPRLWAAGRHSRPDQATIRRSAWAWRHRCLALERTLDELSDRLARTEVALFREEQTSRQAKLRLAKAESALIRVQSTLEALRQSQGNAA